MPQNQSQPAFSRLADFLLAKQFEIINRWTEAIRRNPAITASDNLTHRQLIDHLPTLLDELCGLLRNGDAVPDEARRNAQAHGRQRWQQQYNLDELVREVELLRIIILFDYLPSFMLSQPDFGTEILTETQRIIHQFFGELTIDSVDQFVADKERQIQLYSEQLEAGNRNLKRMDQARLRLTRTVSHELKNIVNAISMASEVLGRDIDDTTRQKMDTVLSRNIADMTGLLDQLLSYSVVIAGREQLKIESFGLLPLYEELVAIYKPMADARGLKFRSEYDSSLEAIVSDRLKVKEIAQNLLSNAIKYTKTGQVGLSFHSRDASYWSIVVEDTGKGIAVEDLADIFDEFHRVESHKDVQGTGLGLAITKRLTEFLSGQIKVSSTIGQSSRFEVTLPKVNAPKEIVIG